MPCPKCGHALKPGARFCTSCGAALAPAAPSTGDVAQDKPVDVELSSGEWPDDVTQPVVVSSLSDLVAASRSHIDSLPLHPVQRGMPDFELPEPRSRTVTSDGDGAVTGAPSPSPVPVPAMPPVGNVTFEEMDRAGLHASGNGAKWLLSAAVALLVVGAAGWWGYRHFSAAPAPALAAESVQPAVDDVADDESVVPSASASDAQDAVADGAPPLEAPAEPHPLTEATAEPIAPAHTPAFVEAAGTDRGAGSAAAGADADGASTATNASARQDRRKPAKPNLDSLLD